MGRRARAESGVCRANGNEDEGRLGLTARRAEGAVHSPAANAAALHYYIMETGVKYYYCAPQRHLSRAIRVPVDLHPPRDSRLLNGLYVGDGGCRGGDGIQTICAFTLLMCVCVCVCVCVAHVLITSNSKNCPPPRYYIIIHIFVTTVIQPLTILKCNVNTMYIVYAYRIMI